MPTSDELFELKQQIDGELSSADKRVRNRAKKIGVMHRKFGKGPEGARCVECQHFVLKKFANVYRKCLLFGNTGGPGTDWSGRYEACGKFQTRVITIREQRMSK